MIKRIFLVFLLLLSVAISALADNKTSTSAMIADSQYDEDYYIGLKAFDDGFYDAARMMLGDYLARDSKSSQSGFATYILYQILMHENKFKAAEVEFRKLPKFKDERFDKRKMLADEITLATKLDCENAHSLILTNANEDRLNIYLDSKCKLDTLVLDVVAKNGDYSNSTLMHVIDKIKTNKNYMMKFYNELSKKERTPKVLNYYGHYFMVEKMDKEFWILFNEYKDEELVNLALNAYWNSQNYDKYANVFKNDVKKEYKLPSVSYCRMIEASNKSATPFDCNIIDNCLGVKSPEFKKTKLACYMKNEDKTNIEIFMKSVSEQEAANLCEYGKYIVAKGLYSVKFIDKFSSCLDKGGMYEKLTELKDAESLKKLVGKPRTQLDVAYLAIYENMVGNSEAFKKQMDNLTEKQFIDLVNSKLIKKAK